MSRFLTGDIVAYHNPHTTDPIQLGNQRQLKDRVGLVKHTRNDHRFGTRVAWTGFTTLDHDPSHLVLVCARDMRHDIMPPH